MPRGCVTFAMPGSGSRPAGDCVAAPKDSGRFQGHSRSRVFQIVAFRLLSSNLVPRSWELSEECWPLRYTKKKKQTATKVGGVTTSACLLVPGFREFNYQAFVTSLTSHVLLAPVQHRRRTRWRLCPCLYMPFVGPLRHRMHLLPLLPNWRRQMQALTSCCIAFLVPAVSRGFVFWKACVHSVEACEAQPAADTSSGDRWGPSTNRDLSTEFTG